MKKVRKHLSYSNLMASFAAFLALGGAAFAVQQVKRNSVNSASIKDGTVTGTDVKDDSLTGADVLESTLALDRRPAGPAGGALTGSYPNPVLAPNSVRGEQIVNESISGDREITQGSITANELGPNSVTDSKIVDETIAASDIGPDSVGGSELKGTTAVVGQGVVVGSSTPGNATVKCPGGSQLVGGGYAWLDAESNSILVNAPSESDPNQTWTVRGLVDSGTNTLFAWANCMGA